MECAKILSFRFTDVNNKTEELKDHLLSIIPSVKEIL